MSARIASLIALLAFVACEGEPGSPGSDQLPFDRYPPSAEIILPLAGKPLQALTTVEISVADDDTVVRQQFLVNGLPADSMFTLRRAPSLYYWNAASLALGRNTLQLRAWDRFGKVGESALLYLNRSDEVIEGFQTIQYFSDSTGASATYWTFPRDTLGTLVGLGTRFTPDRPCRLARIGVKTYKKATWQGSTSLFLDILSEKDGKPDSLLYRKVIRPVNRNGEGEFNQYVEASFSPNIPFDREFFAVLSIGEPVAGDSVALQTDGGGWANGHGLVKYEGGDWEAFPSVRGKKPNPMLYALVRY